MKKSTFQTSRIYAVKSLLLAALFVTAAMSVYAKATVDTSFGTNGDPLFPTNSDTQRITAYALQSNDKIVYAGDVISGTDRDSMVIRLTADGLPDTTFGIDGRIVLPFSPLDDYLNAVAVQTDGKIIVAGNVSPTAGSTNTDFLIARLNENGSLDASFGTNGVIIANQGSKDSLRAIKIRPDGKIVIVGGTSDSSGRGVIFRLNPNGSYDTSFGGGLVLIDRPNRINEMFTSLDFYADGRILIGGDSTAAVSPFERSGFVTLVETSGVLVQSFGNENGFAGRLLFTGFAQIDVMILPSGDFLAGGDSIEKYTSNGVSDWQSFSLSRSDGRFARLPNGNLVITSQGLNYALYTFGGIRVYNKNLQLVGIDEREGAGRSEFYGKILVQSDCKMIIGGSRRLNGVTSIATRQVFFDDDWKADIAVFRPSNYTVYSTRSAFNQPSFASVVPSTPNGQRQIIAENYSGPILSGMAIPRSQIAWYNYPTANSPGIFGVNNQTAFQFGTFADIPVGGDYDGDGRTDYAVFRPSNGVWYIVQSSNNQFRAVPFGQVGDKLVPADYDYDGITDIAVFRSSNGTWYISRSSDSEFRATQFGINGDVPLIGDFDGDGRADFTVFRPSNGVWYSLKTTDGFSAETFGESFDQPVPGDYDGDGKHDIAVFRAGIWYLKQSREGFKAIQWGLPNDVPITIRY